MSDEDAVGDDRTFAAASRYAANAVTGVRWLDDRTGQEQWSRSVGVDTLLQAGATIESPEDVRIATRVKISPHKGSGGWTANITRKQLDSRHEEDGVVKLHGTRDYCESEGFDEREDAVSWAESEVEAYAGAEIKDAVEWSEQRFSKDDGEGEDESADEEADQPEQAKLVTDGGQDAVVVNHAWRFEGAKRYGGGLRVAHSQSPDLLTVARAPDAGQRGFESRPIH